jgi:hypothetical protein
MAFLDYIHFAYFIEKINLTKLTPTHTKVCEKFIKTKKHHGRKKREKKRRGKIRDKKKYRSPFFHKNIVSYIRIILWHKHFIADFLLIHIYNFKTL